jgi:hypothetical protein
MWYVYTMEFYSATNNNEILSFAGKWMELKNIILSTAILWKTGHTKGRLHMRGRERERERERRWIWLMYFLYKNGYRNFKLVKITIGKGLR